MKICLLCYRGNPYCGGQGVYLYFLSRELARMGHSLTILVGSPQPWPMPWAKIINVENLNLWGVRKNFLPPGDPWRIIRPLNFFEFAATRIGFFPEMLIFSIRALGLLKKMIPNENFDILHDVQSLGYGLLMTKFFRLPLVTTVHHPLTIDYQASLERDRNFQERYYTVVFYPLSMQRRVIRHCDRVITSSGETAREIQRAFGIPLSKIRMVYNGLDADFFRPLNNELRKPNSLLFVGNTDDTKKGVLYILQAMTLLPPEVSLTIVDEGAPLKTYAPQLVRELGLTSRVTFTGKLSAEDLRKLYTSSKLVVLPSLYEGFGLPAAEAMACGTPVVATRAGALPEVVGEDGAGILIPPRDPQALAAGIIKVLGDEAGRKQMGMMGRKRVEELFTWEKVAERTVEVYKELLKNGV
ncbi:MAG: glycosyltransferase family 4 protein [Thermodesulfobacteriota bacterium]|nr:glycosyltransferase family 4 protein [Thermodesulfobacteriota bacterium]